MLKKRKKMSHPNSLMVCAVVFVVVILLIYQLSKNKPFMHIPIFYINMSHRQDRRDRFENELAKTKLTAKRIEAYTSESTPLSIIGTHWKPGLNAKYDQRYTDPKKNIKYL